MGVVFIKDVAFAPLADRFDVDFDDLGTNAPGNLEGRAFLVVTGSRGGTCELNGRSGVAGGIQRLLGCMQKSSCTP